MSSNEVKVGAMALGGAAIIAGIISFMGALSFGSSGYQLPIAYPQVSGLMPGHVVRYAGVNVGTVRELQVQQDKIIVLTEIDEKIKIPLGATFTIGSDGILGEKFVSIVPPAKPQPGFIAEGTLQQGVTGSSMEEFFASSGDLVQRLENMAQSFENILGDKKVQESLKQSILNLQQISENMMVVSQSLAVVAGTNQQDMVIMLQQLSAASQSMNRTMQHIESMMAGMDNNGATGKQVAQLVENMSRTSGRIENIVKALEQVAQDPQTVEDLKATLSNVRQTSERANKLLGTVTEAKLSADVSSSASDSNWRSNLGVTMTPSENTSLYVGAYDLGDSNKLDFIASRDYGRTSLSMGAMQGEFGVGMSYRPMPQVRLYSQYYDFNNGKLRLGGEVQLQQGLSLYGETMDVGGKSRDTYIGIRSEF